MGSHVEAAALDLDDQKRKAEIFRYLHQEHPILILPNAWDVASAKVFELEGFKAVGTTSAGIAASLGYQDEERMSLVENAAVVRRIAQKVGLPVNADLEAGYAVSPEGVARSAKVMLQAGAVGLNLEDSTHDPAHPLFEAEKQAERIQAVRDLTLSEGIPVVINARIDTYLHLQASDEEIFRCTINRARAYKVAGADCIFIPSYLDKPGLLDEITLARLVDEIDAPVNVLAGAVTLPVPKLEEIGVARVSVGPGPMRACLALIRKIGRELLQEGTYSNITENMIPFTEVNQWFL